MPLYLIHTTVSFGALAILAMVGEIVIRHR